MARPLRIEFPGALYHITSRGNEKQLIFIDGMDKKKFLEVLSSAVKRFNWICHAYCLMGNHYHLIIETPEGNISRGVRHLNGVYTQIFNRRHKRVGHLFQGRYKSILVEKESYLLSLCRYVVLNPVRIGLVERPEDWNWSSYRSSVGAEKKPSFLTVDWLLSQFGNNNRTEAIRRYKRFVLNGIAQGFPKEALRGQIFLGRDNFIKKFEELLKEKKALKEVPRVQRYATRPHLDDLFCGKKIGNKNQKDKAIYVGYVRYGYTLKEIAEYLGVHYVTISRAVKRVEKNTARL